jgi:hypothetical protein
MEVGNEGVGRRPGACGLNLALECLPAEHNVQGYQTSGTAKHWGMAAGSECKAGLETRGHL